MDKQPIVVGDRVYTKNIYDKEVRGLYNPIGTVYEVEANSPFNPGNPGYSIVLDVDSPENGGDNSRGLYEVYEVFKL